MKKLLHKDVNKRIDYKDIPSHPWFESIDFNKVLKLEVKPEFIPETKSIEDISNIDPIFLNEEITSPYRSFKPTFDDKLFSDF